MAFAISYHSETDRKLADALSSVAEKDGLEFELLDQLPMGSFVELPTGNQRRDAWIEYYLGILERSVGMLVISGRLSEESRKGVAKGMWIEDKLARVVSYSNDDYVAFVEAPKNLVYRTNRLNTITGREFGTLSADEANHYIDHAPEHANLPDDIFERLTHANKDVSESHHDMDTETWAMQEITRLRPWLEARLACLPPGAKHRFKAEEVNDPGPYSDYEIQYAPHNWFHISVLDLYDRVWHCQHCFASSDVWLSVESRPPAACPACGNRGCRSSLFIRAPEPT